jgi:hypothetical protein
MTLLFPSSNIIFQRKENEMKNTEITDSTSPQVFDQLKSLTKATITLEEIVDEMLGRLSPVSRNLVNEATTPTAGGMVSPEKQLVEVADAIRSIKNQIITQTGKIANATDRLEI